MFTVFTRWRHRVILGYSPGANTEGVVGLESDPGRPGRNGWPPAARNGRAKRAADGRQDSNPEFAIEDMWVGVFSAKVLASGFGQVGDGRSFAFRIEGHWLRIEIYRRRMGGPVPQPEDVVDTVRRDIVGVDVTDERSLTAAVRDAVAQVAEPVFNSSPLR